MKIVEAAEPFEDGDNAARAEGKQPHSAASSQPNSRGTSPDRSRSLIGTYDHHVGERNKPEKGLTKDTEAEELDKFIFQMKTFLNSAFRHGYATSDYMTQLLPYCSIEWRQQIGCTDAYKTNKEITDKLWSIMDK